MCIVRSQDATRAGHRVLGRLLTLGLAWLVLACSTPSPTPPTPHLLGPMPRPNLLRNGNLQTPGSWEAYGMESGGVTLAHDQSGFLTLAIEAGGGSQSAGWAQSVPVQAGMSYVASCRMHTEGLAGLAAQRIRFYDAQGQLLAEAGGLPTMDDTPWGTFAYRCQAPPAAVRAEVRLGVTEGSSGRVAFDDVELIPDDAPVTRALIVNYGQTVGLLRCQIGIDGAATWQGEPIKIRALPGIASADWRALFPNVWADPNDPTAYDFQASDAMVAQAVASGSEVFFRLGGIGEGQESGTPPSPERFAAVARHIVMHYNEGWADGYHYGIRHWELWPAADRPGGWPDGVAPYTDLAATVTAELKALDAQLRVGGPGLVSPVHSEFLRSYLSSLVADGVLPDLLTWQDHYPGSPYARALSANYMQVVGETFGLEDVETVASAWGPPRAEATGDASDAAWLVAAATYAQDTQLYRAYLAWPAGSLSDSAGNPTLAGQALGWLGRVMSCPQRLETHGDDRLGFALLAGKREDGRSVCILVADTGSRTEEYRLGLAGFPPGYHYVVRELAAGCAGGTIAEGSEALLTNGVLRLPWHPPAVHFIEITWPAQ